VAAKLDEIEEALNDVLSASRKIWFADCYHLMPARIRGATTVLQSCYDPKDETELLGKFFPDREAYDAYMSLHSVQAVSVTMPLRHRTFTNDESIYRSPSGFIFPPFVILEKGLPLDEWRSKPQSMGEAMTMFSDLASHLLALHNQNTVYRDFTPKNIVLMRSNSSWRLLRVERCAKKGVHFCLLASVVIAIRQPLAPDSLAVAYPPGQILRNLSLANAAGECHRCVDIFSTPFSKHACHGLLKDHREAHTFVLS
jgi:serine/threonine protein kinase